ncbi:HNH endonuclease signature motif containing protein [Patescibacteria group bacterium]
MTDKQIYKLCQEYGGKSLKWEKKFIALLPIVYKRRIYKKFGFCSIHEFGAKLCGLSHNVVNEALRLAEKFKDMPELLNLMNCVGVSKLRTVAGIADKSTASLWAKRVKTMSRKALETLIRDFRREQDNKITNSQKIPGDGIEENSNLQNTQPQAQTFDFDDLPELSKNQNMSTPGSNRERFGMNLDPETIIQLRIMKQKFEKEQGEPLCWDETMKMVAKKLLEEAQVREYKQRESKSHNIPAKQKREMSKICEIDGCNKPAEEIHHVEPWVITRNHEDLKPLCGPHHELEHQSESKIDKKFRAYKMASSYG